jgi:hypothetical protein
MHENPRIPKRRSGPLLALALTIAGLGGWSGHAASMPLQVSLEALDAPDLAGEQAGASPQAQFVVAAWAGRRQPAAAPAEPDEEVPLVATETLPQALPEPVTEINGLALAAPAEVGLPAVEKALAAERSLGDFMPLSSPDGRDGDDALDEREIAADPGKPATATALPRGVAASAAAAAVIPLPDLDALRQQRATLQWVVLPLVLVAMAVFWVSSQHRRHRHGHSSHHGQGRSRRRRGRERSSSGSTAAPPDPHRA